MIVRMAPPMCGVGQIEDESMATSGVEAAERRESARPARMQALATLPVFFKLAGRRAVVAGGSAPALWKAELLAAAGARVVVFSATLADGFQALAAAPPNGSVTLFERTWTPADLDGAAIAIAACDDDGEAAAFAAAARAAGVPVNVIDRPAFCDFQFGAIINRSPLIMAISTDGGAPVFAQSIRSIVEALLPDGLKHWAKAAKIWRNDVDRTGATPTAKRRFWERFADLAMREAARAPTQDDFAELLREPRQAAPPVAIVHVGSDVDALTLAALRLLRSADRLFFDAAIPETVLDFGRREAHRHQVSASGDDVADRMIAAARQGQRVVYLAAGAAGRENTAASAGDIAVCLREAGLVPMMLNCK